MLQVYNIKYTDRFDGLPVSVVYVTVGSGQPNSPSWKSSSFTSVKIWNITHNNSYIISPPRKPSPSKSLQTLQQYVLSPTSHIAHKYLCNKRPTKVSTTLTPSPRVRSIGEAYVDHVYALVLYLLASDSSLAIHYSTSIIAALGRRDN